MFGLFNGSNNDIVDDIEAVLRPMAGMAIAKNSPCTILLATWRHGRRIWNRQFCC